jgi:hypothetical protein
LTHLHFSAIAAAVRSRSARRVLSPCWSSDSRWDTYRQWRNLMPSTSVEGALRWQNNPSIKKGTRKKMRKVNKYHTWSAEWMQRSVYTLRTKSNWRRAVWRYWYDKRKLRLIKPDLPKAKWINKFLWWNSLQYNFIFDFLFFISRFQWIDWYSETAGCEVKLTEMGSLFSRPLLQHSPEHKEFFELL